MKKPSNSKVIIIPKTPQNQTASSETVAPEGNAVPTESPVEEPAQPEDPTEKKN